MVILTTLTRSSFSLIAFVVMIALVGVGTGCRRQTVQKQGVRPRMLRDVPAERLAYQFNADTEAPRLADDDPKAILPAIQSHFKTDRPVEALINTVLSPDGQRVLAIYDPKDDEINEFRIDLYEAEGKFLRNVTPEGLAVVFDPVVGWSPDGNYAAFIAYKSTIPQPTPTRSVEPVPGIPDIPDIPEISTPSPSPLATTGPTVALFNTEQIYICNRDGYDLRPLTTREGLIYFYFSWAPDSHALASLACPESEWRTPPRLPAGRPRLVSLDGRERLLDDALTDVLPVWSPDASKVATAFDTDVRIYDALTDSPTQARIPLREPLITASRAYTQKHKEAQKDSSGNSSGEAKDSPSPEDKPPFSFQPVVTLEWPQPETLFVQTGYVLNYENVQVREYMRWHVLRLSAQAALLGLGQTCCTRFMASALP